MLQSSKNPSCGQLLLEIFPHVMQTIRGHMRSQRTPDLSVPQFRVLAFVSRNPGSSLSDAAGHVGLSKPSMSTLVEALVRRGLLTRISDGRDRRRMALALSRRGIGLLERARSSALSLLDVRFAPLPAGERRTLAQGLHILRRLFHESSQSHSGACPPRIPPLTSRRRSIDHERSPA